MSKIVLLLFVLALLVSTASCCACHGQSGFCSCLGDDCGDVTDGCDFGAPRAAKKRTSESANFSRFRGGITLNFGCSAMLGLKVIGRVGGGTKLTC